MESKFQDIAHLKGVFISIYGFFWLSESGNACIYIKIPSSLDMEILRRSACKCRMHCWRRIYVTESSFICPQSPFFGWLIDAFPPSFQLRESDPVRVPLRQLPQGLPPPAAEILPQEGARRRGGGGRRRRPAQVGRWHAQLSDHHKEAVSSLNISSLPR